MTQEERRALFERKAVIGGMRNAKAATECAEISRMYLKGGCTLAEAITFAWASGCEYGKDHAEELKIFDK